MMKPWDSDPPPGSETGGEKHDTNEKGNLSNSANS